MLLAALCRRRATTDTDAAIDFVSTVLFPYARAKVASYVAENWCGAPAAPRRAAALVSPLSAARAARASLVHDGVLRLFVEQSNDDVAHGLLAADAPERAIYGDDTKGDHVSAYADSSAQVARRSERRRCSADQITNASVFPSFSRTLAQQHLVANFIFQMDANRKTTSLVCTLLRAAAGAALVDARVARAKKLLQGKIWEAAYEQGVFKGHVYSDVVPALEKLAPVAPIYIYSSGSVAAQKASDARCSTVCWAADVARARAFSLP